MLFFTSDNGPEVNQPGVTRGLVGRKRDFTEGGIRMPTLLEWPSRIQRNYNLSDWPAVSNDILPTVMDALGVKSTTGWPLDGISLLPLLAELGRLDSGAALGGAKSTVTVTADMIAPRASPIGHATGQPGDAFPPLFLNGSGVVGPAPPRVDHDLMQKQFAWTEGHMKIWAHYEVPSAAALKHLNGSSFKAVPEEGRSIPGRSHSQSNNSSSNGATAAGRRFTAFGFVRAVCGRIRAAPHVRTARIETVVASPDGQRVDGGTCIRAVCAGRALCTLCAIAHDRRGRIIVSAAASDQAQLDHQGNG